MVQLEPPTKRAGAGRQSRARAALADAFETDILTRHARDVTRWPKPRAAIALDVILFSGAPDGARVDSICKWLLDELAGLVYADDRQVKLLFARVGRARAILRSATQETEGASDQPQTDSEPHELFGQGLSGVDKSSPTRRQSDLHITAQTYANVLADLRAVLELEDRWDPFDEEHGLHREDPVAESFRRDELVDYRSMFDTNSDSDLHRRRLLGNQIDYHDQAQEQTAVDRMFSSLFTSLPVDRLGIWRHVRGQLSFTPYVFSIGVLPAPGESAAFRKRLRAILEERRQRWPGLFPMRARSGISMILFEEPERSKDLDNLMRSVLPDILEVLRPQRQDLHGWVADEPDPSQGTPDVPFIEVAAFPAHLSDMPPGSVVFGLSTADRYDSWWALATDHLERDLEGEEDRGWW